MTFKELVNVHLVGFVDGAVIPLLYMLAFLFFIYGVATAFFSSNDEKRKGGRAFALWGIIALVVMFSVWGIIKVFLSALQGQL